MHNLIGVPCGKKKSLSSPYVDLIQCVYNLGDERSSDSYIGRVDFFQEKSQNLFRLKNIFLRF